MILVKYILKKIFKNQLVILTVLLLVCFCQKLIKMLSLIVDANISIYLMFLCLGLNIPEEGKLLIPFSAFISVLVTFYRFHIHNEVIAMYSCAIDKYLFIKSILFFSGIVSVFAIANMAWLSPYCTSYQSKLMYEIKENINLVIISEKKFQSLSSKYLTLFADSVQGNKLKYIFIAKKNRDKDDGMFTIITADQGNVCQNFNGSQLITLEKGTHYKICNKYELCRNFLTTNFSQYTMLINRVVKTPCKKNRLVSHMSMSQLFNSIKLEERVELHWRLTLLISIFIMSVITVLLMVAISYSYLLNVLVAFFLYVIFFLLHTLIRFYVISDKENVLLWMWIVNGFYLLIVLLVNLWYSVCVKYFFLKVFHHNYIKI